MKPNIIEHQFLEEKLAVNGLNNESNAETFLGLYLDWSNETGKFEQRVNYYVGACWVNKVNNSSLHVQPKLEKLNYLKIFSECLSNPIVAKNFSKTYKIFFNQPLITVEESQKIDITLLLIVHFLTIVKTIGKKGLKKGYVSVKENLTGKIKGKINIQQNIGKNLTISRADRTACQYQLHTQDCLENRLIKTALQRVSKYLYHNIEKDKNNDDLFKILKFNQFSFEGITEIKVCLNDFKLIKHSAFYAEYKEALRLAEMIFKRLGFNPQKYEDQVGKTPAFYIDMPELFERYVEVQLRRNYTDILAGYGHESHSETRSTWDMRPDFLIPSKGMIVDAKYKGWYKKETTIDFKEDFQQLSLYSRTKDFLKKLNLNNQLPKLIFIYPLTNGASIIDLDDIIPETKFEEIYKIGISLPLL